MDSNSTSSHRRTRSLDLTDSLDRIEMLRKRRQHFLENRAKFNQNEYPASVSKPQLIKSSSLIQANDESDSTRTLPVSSYTESDDADSEQKQARSVTPISELIQRFTTEILNSESSQSQVSASKFMQTNDKSSSPTILSMTPKKIESPITAKNEATIFAIPFIPPNWAKNSNQESNTEDAEVTLRRPSEFLRNESGRTLSRQSSLEVQPITETGRKQNITSLQMSITKPEIFQSLSNSPKLPRRAEKMNVDETDSKSTDFPSWIPLSQNSNGEKSTVSESNVFYPRHFRSSSFRSTLLTKDSKKSSEKSQNVLSPKKLNIDETDSRTSDHPSWVPLSQDSKEEKSSVSKDKAFYPRHLRSSAFQSTLLMKNGRRNSEKAQSYLSSKKLSVDETDLTTSDNPSLVPSSHSTNGKKSSVSRSNIPQFYGSPSYQSTSASLTDKISNTSTSSFVSETQNSDQNIEESVEIRKHSTTSINRPSSKLGDKYIEAVHSPKFTRRHSSNSLMSFPRRSQTPTVPVKSLVQKYSSNASK